MKTKSVIKRGEGGGGDGAERMRMEEAEKMSFSVHFYGELENKQQKVSESRRERENGMEGTDGLWI